VTAAFVYSSSKKPASWCVDTCVRSSVGSAEKSEVSACSLYPCAPISATFPLLRRHRWDRRLREGRVASAGRKASRGRRGCARAVRAARAVRRHGRTDGKVAARDAALGLQLAHDALDLADVLDVVPEQGPPGARERPSARSKCYARFSSSAGAVQHSRRWYAFT
jgi:hypothetical protein